MNIYCYNSQRIYTFYHEAKKILRGELPIPRMALIYPSRVCNHSCYYCSDRWGNKKMNNIMPKDKFLALPERLRNFGVESCELCGGGEPFLHPDIEEFIKECIRVKLKLASLTNGTKLKGNLLETVVPYFSYVRVSIDTFDPKIYKQIRKPETPATDLDHVLDNIRKAILLKNKLKSKIQIGIRLSINRNNIHEITESIKKAKEIGCDSIQIKMVRNSGEEDISKKLLDEGKKQLSYAAEKIKGIVILGSLDKYSIDHKCWLSPCHIFIDTTGETRICCYYQFREAEHTYGNVFNEPIEKVWFSERHKEVLRNIDIEECNKWDCKYFIYNKLMKEALIEDEGQWQFI